MEDPVAHSKLLHNLAIEPMLQLDLSDSDPDIRKMTLENLTIQPTTMKSLKLHIGTVYLNEKEPSSSLKLALNGPFPQTVRFKNKTIVIEEAEFNRDGYLRVKVRKERPDQRILEGVSFFVSGYYERLNADDELRDKVDAVRGKLDIPGWERAEAGTKDQPYLDLYMPAPKQDQYLIELQRVGDPIAVNKDFPIKIK